jgi:hypothetical protein
MSKTDLLMTWQRWVNGLVDIYSRRRRRKKKTSVWHLGFIAPPTIRINPRGSNVPYRNLLVRLLCSTDIFFFPPTWRRSFDKHRRKEERQIKWRIKRRERQTSRVIYRTRSEWKTKKKKKKEKEWRVRRDKRSTHTEAIRLNRGSLNWTEERRRRKKKVDGGDWVASAIGRPHPFVGWVALWIDTQKHHVKAPTSLFVWPWFSPLTLSLR